jgi:hypothetical protein
MTSIKRVGSNSVRLTYTDILYGRRVQREFTVPHCGGYVREDDKQVCVGLSRMGPTLVADPDTLLDVIRKEWKSFKRAMDKFNATGVQ